jgi:nucleotide-binding universal stress UspA family protein
MIPHAAFEVRQILAATDFSALSDKALEAALALAQHFGAQLHVLHVAGDALEQQTTQVKLESLTAEAFEGVGIVKAISVGQAAPEIVKYAEREKIDVIVLGTHGRSCLARLLMGSVAEAVVRAAPCQVLTIGPKAPAIEEADSPAQAAPDIPQSRCLVCAKPSQKTICDSCKAYIQGEAIERKRREEQAGHRGLNI